MSNQTQTARSKPILASNPTIYNLSMPTANTEYSQSLNNSTKKILIRTRNGSQAKFAFVAAGTTTAWITIKSGAVYFEENLDLNSATIYIQSSGTGEVAEILEWT